MKTRSVMAGVLALALSALTAQAYSVSGVVKCPEGKTRANIYVFIQGTALGALTDSIGYYAIALPGAGDYTVCLDPTSVPTDITSFTGCQKFSVSPTDLYATVNFSMTGPWCGPVPPGPCWLTGGGTIGKTKGVPDFSYGGVVYPGCSPEAAEGGNWNVVAHAQGLHFKGLVIEVISCGGVSDKAPKVDVNTIDFQGVGILEGVDGNPMTMKAVCFRAQAIDKGEPGGGKDALYLNVTDCDTGASLLLISTDTAHPTVIAPVDISTGNLQIHTTSCNN